MHTYRVGSKWIQRLQNVDFLESPAEYPKAVQGLLDFDRLLTDRIVCEMSKLWYQNDCLNSAADGLDSTLQCKGSMKV